MDAIELIADDKVIKMEVNTKEWCKLYFIKEGIITKLGAEGLTIIMAKLLIAFATITERKYIVYNDMAIFVVVCLMEPHTTIVGRDIENSSIELLCIEDGGTIMPLMTLSINDIKRWIIQLTNFAVRYNKIDK